MHTWDPKVVTVTLARFPASVIVRIIPSNAKTRKIPTLPPYKCHITSITAPTGEDK